VVESQNLTSPGETAVPPDVTAAVSVTTVCGDNGESGELDGDTVSAVDVASELTSCVRTPEVAAR
jgi:hypothetical protein